ncbi:MAG TPA: alpha/beta hydrolase [Burkholderiales bacterium]|nr:alpha/beta hydrolase [Burkholderiales bacterium]
MTVPHRTGRCASGDVTLYYRRLGAPGATPLLFVHGLSYFSYDWLEVAQALAADREAVCMDMRGFGDSEWSAAKDYSVPTMAADIANLLDHLGWRRAIVFGHSMGGRSAAYFAARNPARAAGLVLVDYSPENAPAGAKRTAETVGGTPDAFASVDEAMRYFRAGPDKRARFEAYLAPAAGGLAVKRDPHFREQFRKILETGERPKLGVDMWQVLAGIRCPALVVRGARSDMFAPGTVEKMQAANAHMRVVEVDAGHNVAGENPAGFLAALHPFVASLKEAGHEYARH